MFGCYIDGILKAHSLSTKRMVDRIIWHSHKLNNHLIFLSAEKETIFNIFVFSKI